MFFSKPCQEKVRRGYQKWNLQVQRKTLRHFFWKFILPIFFGHWPKVPRGFLRKFSASLSKLDSLFQRKLSAKNFFLCKSYNLFFFGKSSGKISSDCRELFRRFWSCFLPLQGNLSKKSLEKFLQPSSTFFSIITGNCAANVWWACQNCNLRIYWNNLKRKTVLENNLSFSSFLDS